jgi:serine/threonine-protein kinase
VSEGNFAQGLIGVTLDGRYRLDAVLGEGGMGSVFRATQLAMDRKVAVKLLKPHLTSDEAALQRFAREARATLKVESPHAVKILDFGVTPLRDYYMVLEYLDGRTVQRELEIDGPFAPARVAHIARQALHALGAAHGQGLIHRDVKPDNLLLMRAGGDADYTKILDFGVAKLMQGAASDRSQLALTAAGMVFGTPEFMSPEQACGHALDGRSDLYSLAVTMFVMLTGTGLFEGNTAIEWLTHHARTPAPRLAMVRPELAAYPELDDLLQRCLAKHREQRPETAAAMTALIAAVEPTLTRAPRPSGGAAAPAGHTIGHAASAHGQAPEPAHGYAAEPARGPRIDPPVTPSPSRATAFRESSYFRALHDGELDSATGPRTAQPDLGSAELRAPALRRSRRGLYFWLGVVAIASLLGVALGVAVRRSTSGSTSMSEPAPHAEVAIAAPADAGPRDDSNRHAATPKDAAAPSIPVDARHAIPAAPPTPLRAVPAIHAAAPARNPVADEHLRSAEEAYQSNLQLKQLAEADLALRADPRSIRARFLLGDALTKAGDLDRGCAYLRALKRYQPALDRARAAGCPGD